MQGWWDIDRTLSEIDAYRRQMDAVLEAFGPTAGNGSRQLGWSAGLDATVRDEGAELVLRADVPGFKAEDLDLQVTAAGVALAGRRGADVPEGYTAHRRERRAYQFSRSFALPVKVDPQSVAARLENGVLTVHLKKSADAQPRRISVSA